MDSASESAAHLRALCHAVSRAGVSGERASVPPTTGWRITTEGTDPQKPEITT